MTQITMERLLPIFLCLGVSIVLDLNVILCDRGDYLGCYRFKSDDVLNIHAGQSVDVCLSACEELHFKYAVIGNESSCFCGNLVVKYKLPPETCNTPCPKNETQKCGGTNAASVYDTEVTAPGPPEFVEILNITESTVTVRWSQPQAHSLITGYILRTVVLETYAEVPPSSFEWKVSNKTFQFELVNLNPGSLYNVSISAANYEEEGPNVTTKVETVIGTPDPTPPDIEVLERRGERMVVHIPKAKNNNGPVSMYRIVVSIELYQQGFILENLGNYTYSQDQGLPYYITAELDPDDIEHDFVIGDRSTYNGFYNAPLPLTNDIEVSLGIVSEKSHVKKIRYAESTKKIILNINEPEEVSPMILALGAGIAIGVVLLLIGIGAIIVLRKRIYVVRRQRNSQSMPLSLSEPSLDIENSGFLQEEDERVDYYSKLKRKLWNIPRNLIDVDISCIIGVGTYGKFTKCRIQQNGAHTTGLVQVISDRDLEKSDRKHMLQEMDLLIKSSEHENVLSLIGFCETNTTLFVVLQDTKQTFKELLLQSRQRDLQNNKFCQLPEKRILQMCTDVARGMEYLHAKKIFHRRLCCRNIVIADSGVCKISGLGLSHIRPLHETPDYTRWTAQEILKQSRFTTKADVWSFGCLLWEALTIGATPYAHSGPNDVAARIIRGMRPAQPSHVGDELFQLCLQCWQIDPDERPVFTSIVYELQPFADAPGAQTLSFTHYNGFNYEPYISEFELTKIRGYPQDIQG